MAGFGKSETIRWGKISNKIYGQMEPRSLSHGKGKEFPCWSKPGDLVWAHTEQELIQRVTSCANMGHQYFAEID